MSGLAAGAVTAAPGWSGSGSGAEYYVAPGGRDENPGSKSKPFATLERARDEVRKLVAAGLKANVTVWIRSGTYKLAGYARFWNRGLRHGPVLHHLPGGSR